MNKQIEDLMYRAGLTAQGCWDEMDDYDKKSIEKFAELIVRECSNVVSKKTGPKSALNVLEHFGLEESKGWVCPKCGIDRTKEVCPLGYMAAIEGKCPMTMEAQ